MSKPQLNQESKTYVDPTLDLEGLPQGLDRQMFFQKGGYEHCHMVKMDTLTDKERRKRFRVWINQIKDEHKFPTFAAVSRLIGRKGKYLTSQIGLSSFKPPLSTVLDIAFVFDKDPAEIFPELLFLRDYWMQDYKMLLEAAEQCLKASDLKGLAECIHAMKIGSALYPAPPESVLPTKLLLPTKADYVFKYVQGRENERGKNCIGHREHSYEKAERYGQELLNEIDQIRADFDEINRPQITPEATD